MEKKDLATCTGHGELPGEVTFKLRHREKEFFPMGKGREGTFTYSKWHEQSRDRNKPGICSEKKVRWEEGVGRNISWNQILKDTVCKTVKLCFICEDIRTLQRTLNRRVMHLDVEIILELCGLEEATFVKTSGPTKGF